MSVNKCEKGYIKKCLLTLLLLLTAVMIFFLYRNEIKSIKLHEKALLPCCPQARNAKDNDLPLDNLTELCIGRILYDKPQTLTPPRSDVLAVTPWLAPIIYNGCFNTDILNAQFHQRKVRIGLTVFAVKKYVIFMKTFLKSAEQFFMLGHKVNYYVFTDRPNDIPNITLHEGRQLVILQVPSYKRWQEVTMRRMEMIRDQAHKRFYKEVDFLVCVDVDMRFSGSVGVEILSDLYATIHPGYYKTQREDFTYERRPESRAYIPTDEGDFYYAGGNFGGTVAEVYKLTNFCHNAMICDKENNIEAIWHDESYLNKYFLYHKPTKILSPEYLCYHYDKRSNYLRIKRFVTVPKTEDEIRY